MASLLKRLDCSRLIRGPHFRNHFVKRQAGGHRSRGCAAIAREHHQTQTHGLQRLKGCGRGYFERIIHGEDSRQLGIDGKEQDGLPGLTQSLALLVRSADVHARGAHQRCIPQCHAPPLPGAGDPLTGDGVEMRDLTRCDAARECPITNGSS